MGAFPSAPEYSERPVPFGILRTFRYVNGKVNGSDPRECPETGANVPFGGL